MTRLDLTRVVGARQDGKTKQEKQAMKLNNLLSIATLALAVTITGTVQAQERIAFTGTVDGSEKQTIDFPKMHVDGVAVAKATRLGQFSVVAEHDVNLITGVGVASAVLDAGNGDKLFTAIRAVGIPTEVPGQFRVTEYHTILNGTGRFDGATGSFKLVRLIDSTLAWRGTFDGTIRLGQ